MKKFKTALYSLILASLLSNPAAAKQEKIGVFATVKGQAHIMRDNKILSVKTGSPIYEGDAIVNTTQGPIQLMMVDETVFTLSKYANLEINSYQYSPTTETGKVRVSFNNAGMRVSTGKITDGKFGTFKVKTPQGDLDIKGTLASVFVDNSNVKIPSVVPVKTPQPGGISTNVAAVPSAPPATFLPNISSGFLKLDTQQNKTYVSSIRGRFKPDTPRSSNNNNNQNNVINIHYSDPDLKSGSPTKVNSVVGIKPTSQGTAVTAEDTKSDRVNQLSNIIEKQELSLQRQEQTNPDSEEFKNLVKKTITNNEMTSSPIQTKEEVPLLPSPNMRVNSDGSLSFNFQPSSTPREPVVFAALVGPGPSTQTNSGTGSFQFSSPNGSVDLNRPGAAVLATPGQPPVFFIAPPGAIQNIGDNLSSPSSNSDWGSSCDATGCDTNENESEQMVYDILEKPDSSDIAIPINVVDEAELNSDNAVPNSPYTTLANLVSTNNGVYLGSGSYTGTITGDFDYVIDFSNRLFDVQSSNLTGGGLAGDFIDTAGGGSDTLPNDSRTELTIGNNGEDFSANTSAGCANCSVTVVFPSTSTLDATITNGAATGTTGETVLTSP